MIFLLCLPPLPLIHHCLFIIYSELYPIGEYFFAIGCIDGSKSYRPESSIVIDLATAYAFFGVNPAETVAKIKESAAKVVNKLNAKYSKRQVGKKLANLHFVINVFCRYC